MHASGASPVTACFWLQIRSVVVCADASLAQRAASQTCIIAMLDCQHWLVHLLIVKFNNGDDNNNSNSNNELNAFQLMMT